MEYALGGDIPSINSNGYVFSSQPFQLEPNVIEDGFSTCFTI
jgi:hypothetical protein